MKSCWVVSSGHLSTCCMYGLSINADRKFPDYSISLFEHVKLCVHGGSLAGLLEEKEICRLFNLSSFLARGTGKFVECCHGGSGNWWTASC
jgi:hypothetical protein